MRKATQRQNVIVRTTKRGTRRIKLQRRPNFSLERSLGASHPVIVAVDEVGRGSWAGPLACAAVVLPSDRRIYKIRDSKLLDPIRREELFERIVASALAWSVGYASHEELDFFGMSDALTIAGRRALYQLALSPSVVLLDGHWNYLRELASSEGAAIPVRTVVHGDTRSVSIACASILAKVSRDRLMVELSRQYPEYGFESNKGYPSPAHKEALRMYGPSPLHRRSFSPIAALLSRLPETPNAA